MKKQLIITSDVGNEIDDQFALVHALLCSSLDVVGIIPTFFNEKNSVEIAYKKVKQICKILGKKTTIIKGSDASFEDTNFSPGSKFIIQRIQNTSHLYLLAIGGLTDIALALGKDKQLFQKVTIIWVGGGRYPKGTSEANLERDYKAANYVFHNSYDFWQIPSGAYKQMRISTTYLRYILKPNVISQFLLNELNVFIKKYQDKKSWVNPDIWILGDSSGIGVLLEEQKGSYHYDYSPYINNKGKYISKDYSHKIRIYDRIDRTMILQDFVAKVNSL